MRALIAACALSSCAVDRTTAVAWIDAGTEDAAAAEGETGLDVATEATAETDGGMTHASTGSVTACTMASAVCIVSNTGCNVGSYYLYDNQWNCGASSGNECGPESAYGCADSNNTVSWVVTSNQPAGNTAVLSYPAMQANFPNKPLVSSFKTISATFAETSPHVGVYEYGYDIWLNGVATATSNQVMVWVDSYNRLPSATRVMATTFGGRTYDVWRRSDRSYNAFVSTVNFTAGTIDLLEIVNWTIAQGWLPASSTLDQIDFGVEIVSTGGASATYACNNFSISTN